jgi:YggT family protein
MRSLVCLALELYGFAVLAWVVLSWIQVSSGHPLAAVSRFLDKIIYPVVLPLRRVLPPLRLGAAAIDLSPIILLLGVGILQRIVC